MKRLFIILLLLVPFAAPCLADAITIDLDAMSIEELDALIEMATARKMEILGIDDFSEAAPYIGNRNTGKFHMADCSSVQDMKEKNKVPLPSREEALMREYIPCKLCNP